MTEQKFSVIIDIIVRTKLISPGKDLNSAEVQKVEVKSIEAPPKATNGIKKEKKQKKMHENKFALVQSGKCPHCQGPLRTAVQTWRGIGFTRLCERCGHNWHIDPKRRDARCYTCAAEKRQKKQNTTNEIEASQGHTV